MNHGSGKYFNSDGGVYSGQHSRNQFEGYAVDIYASGNRYEGYFKSDKREGQGTMTYTNGSIYTGSWKAGLFDG